MKPDLFNIFRHSFRSADGRFQDLITEQEIDLLFEHKLFKCYLQKDLGGLGLNITQTLQVIEDAAYINGSLGWLVQIGNGGMYFVSNFEESIAKEIFSPANAVIAGSGTATVLAIRLEGGYRLTGSWKYCSGSAYASLFTVTFRTNDSDEIVSAMVPRKDVKVIEDWDTLGMRGTSTNSIEVSDIFIPDKYLFKMPEQKSFGNDPVFNLPFFIYAQAFFIHVVYGIFSRMIEESEKLVDGKKEHWNLTNPARNEQVNTLLTTARQLLSDSKQLTSSLVEKSLLTILDVEEEKQIQEKFVRCALEIRSQTHALYTSMGMDVLYRSHPIAVCFADLITCTQHRLLNV